MNIKAYNPYFVLKENWMNLALSHFLFKNFENGRVNADDLLMAEPNILFKRALTELNEGKYPLALSLLSFVHEYENGVGSSLPFMPTDLYTDILAKSVDHEIPKILEVVQNETLKKYLAVSRLGEERKQVIGNYIKQTFRIIASRPNAAIVMDHFRFDPDMPLDSTRLKILPYELRVASLNLLLPLFRSEEQFDEAITATISGPIFPQFLFKQLREKFPHLVDELFEGVCSIFPAGFRVMNEYKPQTAIVGLDYLLTRNSANPFDLQELMAMKPDYQLLLHAFLSCNTMTLTEMDMLNQMKEAGLFHNLDDEDLSLRLQLADSGKIRLKHFMTYKMLAGQV